MAEAPSRTPFTGEEVLGVLDNDVEEDFDDGMKCSSWEVTMS